MELRAKEKDLAEAAALLILQKSPVYLGGSRGREIGYTKRLR